VNFHDNLPAVLIDIHWFKQALVNILRNALQYAPDGSDVFIDAFPDESGNIRLEIMDSGSGVPKNSLPRLFDKFYRVPGSRSGGTGLGLAISKGIVEAHDGIIFAENREAGGLSIIIKIRSITHDNSGQQI
jgi:two-component system, OmpR family, sensor histidine kinase KdpD